MTELTELGAQIETLTRELRRITALIQTPARRPSISWSDGDEYATADDTGDGWRLRGNNWGINVDRDLTDIECEYLRARTRRPYGVELFEAVALLDELREEGKNPADFIDRPIPQTAAQANVDPDSVDANRSEVGEEPDDTERGSHVAYECLLSDWSAETWREDDGPTKVYVTGYAATPSRGKPNTQIYRVTITEEP